MALLEHLSKNKEARLLFGKGEIEIIKKQLLGIPLKPSEKTRLSRDIKSKFKEIEKISKFKEEFELKKSQEIKFLINESKEIILEKLGDNLKKIVLFGSHARNNPNKLSDIDLAIELKEGSKENPTKVRAKILGEVNKKIDIEIFNSLPKKIKEEIKKEGKIIFENE